MQNIKKVYCKVISTILVVCMLISILPQTALGTDKPSNNNGNGNTSVITGNSGKVDSEYSSLKGRAKQELIVQYKDENKRIDIKEKNKNPKLKNLKSKGKLNRKSDLLEISDTDDIAEVIDTLQQDPNVSYVQPNYELDPLSISNDADIDLQWGMQNDGQSINDVQGTAGIDINLAPVIDVPTTKDITVAVIDMGIDITHEDLVGKIYTNPNEKTNNNKDNDGNGYIGDINGWNFVEGNNDVTDLSGHGTEVAGIIGAAKNNIGIMGVAQNVKMLPLKVIENGVGYTSDVIEAIQYAESMGAKIANCSFGSTYYNYALYEAMQTSNMLFVCAAGNTGTISNIYPASYELPNVLSVTSVDNTGKLALTASYGQYVDIAAPGVDIYSTTTNNSYTYVNGSSFATAYATGVAARLLGIRDMTAAETISVLKQGVTKEDNLIGFVKFGGMLNIAGSYDLIKDGQEINVGHEAYTNLQIPSKVLNFLADNDYSALTDDDKNYICQSLSIPRVFVEECLAKGYDLRKSVEYSGHMAKFGFSLDEVIQLYAMYDSTEDVYRALSNIDNLFQIYNVSLDDMGEIRALILSGYKMPNIFCTYIVSHALQIPLSTLIQNLNGNDYTLLDSTNYSGEEKESIKMCIDNYYLNLKVLLDYMSQENYDITDIETMISNNMGNLDTIIPLADIPPDKPSKTYFTAPFAYKQTGNDKVNLNTGSLTYESQDAVIKGKNGLDVVIATRYDSTNASVSDVRTKPMYANLAGYNVLYILLTSELHEISLWSDPSTTICMYVVGVLETTYDPSLPRYTQEISGVERWIPLSGENATIFCYTAQTINSLCTAFSVSNVYNYQQYNVTVAQSNNELQNRIGIGWSFAFSYIEKTPEGDSFLHLEDGSTYKMNESSYSNNIPLTDYTFSDIILEKNSSYYSNVDGVTSYYVLKHKNGVNEYFALDGRLLAKTDRFGNQITFSHTYMEGKYVINKITDTLGRIITITYPPAGGDVIVSLPDGGQIIYRLQKLTVSGAWASSCKLVQKIEKVSSSVNRTTQFDYSEGMLTNDSPNWVWPLWNVLPGYNDDKTICCENLAKVTYPTGAYTTYAYVKISQTIDESSFRNSILSYAENYQDAMGTPYYYQNIISDWQDGKIEYYRITNRYDYSNGTMYSYEIYSYNNSYLGSNNNLYDPNALPSTYSYTTTVTNSTTGNKIINTFNEQHLPTNLTVTNSLNIKLTENKYTYTNKQLTKSDGFTYASDGVTYQESINNYTYDNYNNLTGQWSPLDAGVTTSTEYKITYAYNPTYNYVTSKQYKRDGNTTVTEEYTPSSDNKTITWKKVYETIGTGAKTLKEATQYLYDSYGNVTEQRRYYGDLAALNTYVSTVMGYTYNTDGTSAVSVQTSGVKDADGTLVTATPGNSAGIVKSTNTYDKMGRLITSTDGKGNITTNTYDLLGRQTKVTNPDSTYKSYAYNDTANALTVTDEKGTATKYSYDGFGNITSVTDVSSGTNFITLTYDTKFRLTQENTVSASSTSGSKTDYTYDALDRVLTKTVSNASNTVLGKDTYVYDIVSSNSVVTHTVAGDANSPDIKTTTYTDNAGRTSKQGYFIGTTEYTDDYTYDYVGNKVSVKTAQTKNAWNSYAYTNKWDYDYANRVTNEYDIYGKYSITTYDALGQKVSFKDPNANSTGSTAVTTYSYDALGRLTVQKTPFEGTAVSTVKYYYDNDNNVTQKKVSSNAVGAADQYTTTGYEYNNRNMLTKATNYNVNGTAASYVQYYYDAIGNKLRMYTGLSAPLTITGIDVVSGTVNSVTKYEYDRFGNLTKMTDPVGYVESYTYDLLGNMLTKSDRNGTIFTYSYDGLGRLLSTVSGGVALESYTYALTGQKRTESNATVTTTDTYDSLGRLTKAEDKNSATGVITTKNYTYDVGSNKLTAVITVGSTTTNNTAYTYDEANRMKSVSEGGVLQCTYNYDVNGNRSSLVYENGVTATYTYNLANMLKTLANVKDTTTFSSYSYTYYLDGNQASRTDNTGFEVLTTSYTYDGLGRLTSETGAIPEYVT
ncbi:MAG: S8 family serine peptidase, partial [Oscillospiraceae bacterium]|nr:S8 family serine peptidase [Oscillospiraceae bacterium]